MAKRDGYCSCGACVRVKRNPPERGDMWLCLGSGCEAVACPACGDCLLPGGERIPAAELLAAWNAMQAMKAGKCHILTRVLGYGKDGETVTFCANGKAEEGRGATPEAAVAALLEKQGGNHAE